MEDVEVPDIADSELLVLRNFSSDVLPSALA